jgi:hypothetical protein
MAKACELRVVRDGWILCGAGGFVLAREGGETTGLDSVCGSCPIPDVVEGHPRACLHLRPIRVQRGEGAWDSHFSCRWFYRLNLRHQPTDLSPCTGCPHWFPRPPMEILEPLGYWRETDAIRAAVAHPEAEEARSSPLWAQASSQPTRRPSVLHRWLARVRRRQADAMVADAGGGMAPGGPALREERPS